VVSDDTDVRQMLREAVEREGNQIAFAKRHGIDRSFLNQVLRGRRQISDAVLKTLGLRKLYVAE
jgi:DNA-binding transcriptional regulator YdaS (Cro superfamily)